MAQGGNGVSGATRAAEARFDVARPRLLFVAHLLPWPLDGGGQIKSYHALRLLSARFDVKLLAFIRREDERQHISALAPLCRLGVENVLLPRSRVRDGLLALQTLASRQSFLIRRDDSPAMRALIEHETRMGNYTALHFDHLQMAQFIPTETGRARIVLDNHNVEYRIPKRIAETGGSPAMRLFARREWPRLREFEARACQRADVTLAVSEEDACALRALAGADKAERVVPVPIGVDTDYFAPAERQPNSQTLLSIGTMFWPPNVDAVTYFHERIWPLVRRAKPNTRFLIVGARPVASVRALAESDPGVTVTGSVPDVRPYASDCAAFVVPLRSGSGMRVKILNALSMGLPVVSTSVGAEGIAVTHEQDILLADSPDDFARACVRLLSEPELGARLGQAGRRLMEDRYGWEAVGRDLMAAYDHFVLTQMATGSGAR